MALTGIIRLVHSMLMDKKHGCTSIYAFMNFALGMPYFKKYCCTNVPTRYFRRFFLILHRQLLKNIEDLKSDILCID